MNNLLYIITTLCLSVSVSYSLQSQAMPEWFIDNMKSNIGTWVTDNSQYMSEEEPYDSYGVEWRYGIGQTSIRGRMFGIKDGKKVVELWEFHQYWDNEKQEVVIAQLGQYNVIGQGTIQAVDQTTLESVQSFSTPDSYVWKEKHVTVHEKEALTTTSFKLNKNQEWINKRTYKWYKKPKPERVIDLGEFSISLSVSNLKASFDFYKNLGFSQVPGLGSLEQNWLILKNGESKIGLFQGMFPENTITFNPKNARRVKDYLHSQNINIEFSSGLDSGNGPGFFTISDPDGNPILIDQH